MFNITGFLEVDFVLSFLGMIIVTILASEVFKMLFEPVLAKLKWYKSIYMVSIIAVILIIAAVIINKMVIQSGMLVSLLWAFSNTLLIIYISGKFYDDIVSKLVAAIKKKIGGE